MIHKERQTRTTLRQIRQRNMELAREPRLGYHHQTATPHANIFTIYAMLGPNDRRYPDSLSIFCHSAHDLRSTSAANSVPRDDRREKRLLRLLPPQARVYASRYASSVCVDDWN